VRVVSAAVTIALAVLLSAVSVSAQTPAKAAREPAPALEKMPQALEVRWELSALPPHLRDSATTYALDPARGYVVVHQGTNGVSCIVVRSDWQWDLPFRADIYWPVCYDAEGSATHLKQYLDAAALRAQGMNGHEAYQEIMARFANKTYRPPAHAGISYMLAPLMRGYPGGSKSSTPETNHLPHYMVYAPNVTDKDIGGEPYSLHPFMLRMSPGHDDVIIFLVGAAEKAQILTDSVRLLSDLCGYRSFLCMDDHPAGAAAHH
jgi:hypothetical protein